MAAMRPLMVAEPMLRAPRPLMAAESKRATEVLPVGAGAVELPGFTMFGASAGGMGAGFTASLFSGN